MIRKVAYFTDSADTGGAEQALLHLLAGLDRSRWQPVLFHHPEPGLAHLLAEARRLDATLHEVPRMPPGWGGMGRLPGFVRVLAAERPAVFHAHLTWPLSCKYGLIGAILARIPAIVATEQLFIDLPYSRATKIQQRCIATKVDCYIAVSHDVRRRLQRTFRIPRHKIEVIHNAVPLHPVACKTDIATEKDAAWAMEQPIVLTVARLDKQKGLSHLLQAAARVPEATFVIAGDGPERARLESQARELQLGQRVVFLGHRRDIPVLLSGCDLFVLPSLYEGLPLSALEAMVAGKPVIATAVGGTDEAIIHGVTGLLVPPADAAALAEAIRRLLSDPALSRRLGMAGKDRVHRHFSLDTMVRSVTNVYDGALGGCEVSRGRH